MRHATSGADPKTGKRGTDNPRTAERKEGPDPRTEIGSSPIAQEAGVILQCQVDRRSWLDGARGGDSAKRSRGGGRRLWDVDGQVEVKSRTGGDEDRR